MSLFAKNVAMKKDLGVKPEEFAQLRDFVYEKSGIFIADNRQYLLENRLRNRLSELNLKSFGEYYYFLRFDKDKENELKRLFSVITTNETSFFRNPPQLKVFQEKVLKEVIDQLRAQKKKRLRIWSAGCSTGEEPYTMAIQIHETLGAELASWDVKITANDLSERVLESAREGVYNEYALRTTPKQIIPKYFKEDGGKFHVKPELKRLIRFERINLSSRLDVKRVEASNIVFCRNVIIYFDDEMKKKVISGFYDNLIPGGYLFIGHSESLHNISRAFKPIHHPGAIVYLKES